MSLQYDYSCTCKGHYNMITAVR